jgi:putative tryptophan/tyrosine transport system substrate-binding protein
MVKAGLAGSPHMRRRDFISIFGSAAVAWPLAARAQQPDQRKIIGVLLALAENDPEGQRYVSSLLNELQQLGWASGRNVQIEYRWTGADPDRIRTNVAELVRSKPDVILANSPLVVAPLQQQTKTIPIVFTQINDPVGSGFVASLSRPGGNITGFTPGEFSMYGKYPEVLKEIAPSITRAAVMLNLEQSPQVGIWRAIEAVAPSIGVHVTAADVRDAAEITRAVESFGRISNGGLIVIANPITILNRQQIITLAGQYRLPAIYSYRYFVIEGGLMSYGADPTDLFRRSASYIDRILKGTKPGDLPIQQPTKFELVINLKTAKELGLTISRDYLLRADEVIE